MARLVAFVLLAAAGLIGPAAAHSLRLGYEAYAGGLHVLSIAASIDDAGGRYRVATHLRTRGLADFFIGMQVDSEATGDIRDGMPTPSRYRNQSRFGSRERSLAVETRPDGGFLVEATPAREEGERRTPVPAASLPGAVDPLTAIFRAVRTVAATGACRQRVAVFDGRRRYDLVLDDAGDRRLAASRYSVFAGPARLCRLRQDRIGGFIVDAGDKDIGRESLVWVGTPLAGTMPVPVRLEIETSWGWLTIHLVEAASDSGSVGLSRDSGAG
jgi:hypothetical protein